MFVRRTFRRRITPGKATTPCPVRGGRAAMTLIEVLVVVVLASLVMGTIGSFVVALMKEDRAIRLFAVEIDRQSELAEALRTDIRRAKEVSLAAPTVLVITSPGERETRYEITGAGCRRLIREPGGTRPRADLFAIGSAAAWTLDRGPAGRRPLYIVKLRRFDEDQVRKRRDMPLFVYAALGADLPR